MSSITFDTHKFVRKLQEAGFDQKQAEGLTDAMRAAIVLCSTWLGLCRQWQFRRLNQAFGRNAQLLVQFPAHVQRQWPLAVQDLINTIQPSDTWHQVLGRQPGLIHAEFDRFNRVR